LNLSYETRLKLHPIEIREDKKNYIVENSATGEFFEMPIICIHAMEMIQNDVSLIEIEKRLKSKYPSEDINLIDFAQQLLELELVHEVDGKILEYKSKNEPKQGFLWIPTKLGEILFNKIAFNLYILLFVSNVLILTTNPQLFPHFNDIFVFESMVLNILLYMVIAFIMVLVHEFGHVLAMRAVGLPTKLEIGHRLFLVVLETDMSSVWKLPAKKRNFLYVAGICFDNVLLFLALITTLLFPNLPGAVLGIIGIIVFDVIIRMLYQCCIYMKTDLYYVFENISGCYNLMENAQDYFKERFFFKEKKTPTQIFEGEKSTIISYGLFYMIGMTVTLSLFVAYYIPQIVYLVKKAIPGLQLSFTDIHFWDALIVVLQMLLGVCLLLYSWRKSYIIQRGQR
jgi:putative peptide zinc metalloprotease protein